MVDIAAVTALERRCSRQRSANGISFANAFNTNSFLSLTTDLLARASRGSPSRVKAGGVTYVLTISRSLCPEIRPAANDTTASEAAKAAK
jgi:hypothetical protein